MSSRSRAPNGLSIPAGAERISDLDLLKGPQHAVRLTVSSVVLALLGSLTGLAQTQNAPASSAISLSEIVQNIVNRNEVRAEDLKYCSSRRHYHVEYHGFGRSLDASMTVEAVYRSDSGKTFTVIDESGSHLLIDHVLKKLLETEQDDSRNHQAALTPANYRFDLLGSAAESGRQLYVLGVEPRVKKKLLYRGKIWVDGEDFAVVRVEAQPAENPSFWIKNAQVQQIYAKLGEFWLPQRNTSQTKVRLGGTAVLTIDYGNYRFDPPDKPTFDSAFLRSPGKP
jgi:hypothetical protein